MFGDPVHVAPVPVAKQLPDVPRSLGASVIVIEKVRRERISSYGIVAGCPASSLGPARQHLSSNFVYLMRHVTGKQASLTFAEWRPESQKVYISDIQQSKEMFGWEAEISRQEGVGRLTHW